MYLLVGCGAGNLDEPKFRSLVKKSITTLQHTGVKTITWFLLDPNLTSDDVYSVARYVIESMHEKLYIFSSFKKKNKDASTKFKNITLATEESGELKNAKLAISDAEAVAEGVSYAKDLANQPSNVCTPTYLANKARELAKSNRKLKVDVA